VEPSESGAAGSIAPASPHGAIQIAEAGKWVVAASVLLGSFVSVMDSTIVNVSMPHMMGTFGTDLINITWVSTSYSIAQIIMIAMAAWWSTLLGRKRLYLFSMALFLLGSVLAGLSQTLTQMIVFRVIQGIGGGSLMPVSQAIVREKFPPEEQAIAMSLYAMGVILAPAIGPVIGGLIVDSMGWPWVFYVNVPFCIIGMMMVSSFVQDPPYLRRGLQKIDWAGLALLGIGITTLQIVLERGERLDWFESNWIIAGSLIAAFSLGALAIWEMRVQEPIANFRLFSNRPLAIGSIYISIISFGLFGSTFILPQYTETLLGYTAYQTGLVMVPRSIAMFLMMPLSGLVYNYCDTRIQVTAALGAMFVSFWMMSHFALNVGYGDFLACTTLMGVGIANSNVVMSTMSLSTIPRPQMTQASSLFTLSQRVSGNVAYAVLATMLARNTQTRRSYLIGNLSYLKKPYLNMHAGLVARLLARGQSGLTPHISVEAAQHQATVILNHMVNAHATMLAYNDIYWFLLKMLLVALVVMWLAPRNAFPKPTK
jgi:MFS transporter, DHA2 family, multidrug resistance protein